MSRVDDLVEEVVQHQRYWFYRARNEVEQVLREKRK